jgi:hypothetical protein
MHVFLSCTVPDMNANHKLCMRYWKFRVIDVCSIIICDWWNSCCCPRIRWTNIEYTFYHYLYLYYDSNVLNLWTTIMLMFSVAILLKNNSIFLSISNIQLFAPTQKFILQWLFYTLHYFHGPFIVMHNFTIVLHDVALDTTIVQLPTLS